MTYNASFDICKEITPDSGHESKSAADEACDQAFRALDDMQLNICHGWRHAECRFIEGEEFYQCTCIIPNCGLTARSKMVRPFRDCAPELWTRELSGDNPAPTPDFQKRRAHYDDIWQKALSLRAFGYPGHHGRTGGSGGVHYPGENSGGASSSSGKPVLPQGPAETYAQNPRQKPYQCYFCGKRYSSKHALVDHKRSHTTGDTRCRVCGRILSTRAILKSHMQNVHPNEPFPEAGPANRNPEDRRFVCDKCGKPFATRTGLRDHTKSHTSMDTYCIFCNLTLSNKSNYRVHMQKRHPEVATLESAAKNQEREEKYPEKCEECNRRFKNTRGLRDHTAFHEGRTTCSICKAVLLTKSSLATHKRKEHPK